MEVKSEQQAVSCVLIVEDDASQLRTLTAISRDEGFEVAGCATSKEALERIAQGDIDVGIIDIGLPDIGDVQFLDRLSEVAGAVPLIVYTGRSSYQSAQKAVNVGAFAYLEKGSDPTELLAHVHRALIARVKRYAEALESAVAERTRQLQEANQTLKREIEERKRAEEAVRASEVRYRTIFEHSPEMIVIVDPQGRLVDVNSKAVELIRYRREDCLDKHFSQLPFWSAETAARIGQQFARRIGGADVPPYEVEFLRQDGEKLICTVHGAVLRNDDGEIRNVLMIVSDITARKRAEDALRSARDRVQHLLDIAGVLFVALDDAGTITPANRRACDTLRYREEQLAGQNWFETCVPESVRDEVRRVFRELIAGTSESAEYYENPVVTSDGTERLIAWHNSLVHDERGAPVGTLSSGEDVTDRRRAESQLRASEERFQMLFEQAPLGYQSLDESGRLIAVNQTWLEMLRYARDEVLGRWFADFLTPKCVEEFRTAFLEFKTTGQMRGSEYQVVCKDGSYRLMSLDGNLGYDRRGRFRQTHFTLRDITEHKRAEEALARSEHKLATVYNSVPVMMILLDQELRVRRANRAACKASGREPGEFNGLRGGEALRCVHALHDPQGCGLAPACQTCGVRNMVIETLQTGQAHERQEQRYGVEFGGQETEVHVLASSVRLLLEGRPHVLLSLEDVTEQRHAERQLRQREAELAQMGRRHTVGEMAGALAHELNQPLYAINNYVRGIQRRLKKIAVPAMTELIDATEQVSKEVNRAAHIVTHLREFVRGRGPHRSSVDVGQLLHQAVELLQAAARDKGVILRIKASAGIPIVQADAVQVEQVLVNLVANEIDAVAGLPVERRTVTLAARWSDQDAVELAVRDCGRGIPEGLQGKVFEAFVTTKEHGLGLGLPISRSIVESHGGKVWMVPNEPHGTAVHFTLPHRLVKQE